MSNLSSPHQRSTDTWVDFNFFGHQLSLHLAEPFKTEATALKRVLLSISQA